jgi:hypothetical protein
LEHRKWFSVTELADEHARKPGTIDIDGRIRAQFIDEVRRSILSGEFSEGGRSKVLNMHPSGLAEWRFDVLGASNPEQFDPIASHLWIGREWWQRWLDQRGITSVGRVAFKTGVSAAPPAGVVYRIPEKATEEQLLQAIRDEVKSYRDSHSKAPNQVHICKTIRVRLQGRGLKAINKDIMRTFMTLEFADVRRGWGHRADFDDE